MSGWLLLVLGVVFLVLAVNAWWPRQGLGSIVVSWFAAMLVVELAPQNIVFGAALAALIVWLGGVGGAPGIAGLVLLGIALLLMLPHALSGIRTKVQVDGHPGLIDLDGAPRMPWIHSLVPLLGFVGRGVRVRRGVAFAPGVGRRKLLLDIYSCKRPADHPLPAVIWVHGGAWVFGTRNEQGVPMMRHLAANGFVAISVDYRLSPDATMPDHIVDVKRAIAWVREHAGEYGIDPAFITITGGSAGGHLAALAALTEGDRTLQPGFEEADTSVQAAVPFYGIYDLLDEQKSHSRPLRKVLAWAVMKARPDAEPDLFRAASPLHRIHAGAPPFFIIHGSADTLVPVANGRDFAQRLRDVSEKPVLYAEMLGGQHAFDVFSSVRTRRVLCAVERFLTGTYDAHRDGHELVGKVPSGEREATTAL